MNITVPKEELIVKLVENRRQHKEVALLARKGYQEALVQKLEEYVVRAKNGEVISYANLPDKPSNHTEDYDRAIAMVELASGDTVELDAEDFSNFILDKWDWKRNFTVSAAAFCLADDLLNYSNYAQESE